MTFLQKVRHIRGMILYSYITELRRHNPVHIFSSDVSKSVSRVTRDEVVANYRISVQMSVSLRIIRIQDKDSTNYVYLLRHMIRYKLLQK